ncbi:glucose-1-phosphate adenylyltransferase subunit GlgD [Mesoaciditoga lauensis]|uniref:glucose-1-phosphate adenylyltransferase subunit GlgD n=1 Tax=Mesoaciditoga lauensis TaxID=1495039 RepID=UPI00055C41E0
MKVLGLILAGDKGKALDKLTKKRASAAMPVGGKYRAIDFTLSNMVRSGVRKVGVITQYNPRSLMDHLGSGRDWDLDRKHGGLYILQPYADEEGMYWYRGTADAIFQNMTILKRGNEDYVLIGSGDHIYNFDFNALYDYHMISMADITVMTKSSKEYNTSLYGTIKTDEEGRILQIKEKSEKPAGDLINLGVYFMNKKLLMDLLYASVPNEKYDFLNDVVISNLKVLRVMSYKFTGYWKNIKKSVQEYKRINMDMLDSDISTELFYENGRIFTKLKDLAPPKVTPTGSVENSIVADGSIISGRVRNSVIFRNVQIKSGAMVEDSIVMEGSIIEEGAKIFNCILDKNVTIRSERTYKGYEEPLIFEKWQVV